jgi:demethylmenaquinone methyltransferase/2-methoxy-6-polyprenyl-1,4-benzoquinol methylase
MQPENLMRDYYAARAQEYDAVYAKPERQPDLRRIEAWLPKAFENRRVLEIACGTGYWTQFFAPVSECVVALDAAPETLEIAKARPKTKGVDFRLGDAYELPDHIGFFDAAFAGFWFSHIPLQRIRPFLEGLHKMLEPQSLVLFVDNLYVEGSSTPVAERDSDGNTYQLRKLKDGTSHRVLKNFPSKSDLERWINGIGTGSNYRAFDYYWAFSYITR